MLGAGLMAAGSLLSAFGSNKAAKAQAAAYAAEQERQQKYLQQQLGAFDSLMPRIGRSAFDAGTAAKSATAMSQYRGAMTGAPQPALGFTRYAPARVAQAFAPGGAGVPSVDAQIQQAAAERGVSDTLADQREGLAEANRRAALARTLAARSQSAFAPEMQQAAGQGAATRGLGDLASAFGSFGLYKSLMGL